MTPPDPAVALERSLIDRYHRLLRAPVRGRLSVCTTCGTQIGFECYQCDVNHPRAGVALADRTAFLVCANLNRQTAAMMYTYKATPPSRENRDTILSLLLLWWSRHRQCPQVLAGMAFTRWATVPSLTGQRQGPHPLNTLWKAIMSAAWGLPEVGLLPQPTDSPRAVRAEHFQVAQPLNGADHVLLLDDTWTSGGHMQSAAAALHLAGASQVSALAIARWFGTPAPTQQWVEASTVEYSNAFCPWTLDGVCPQPPV